MNKNVLIISFNNYGKLFWSKHLSLDETNFSLVKGIDQLKLKTRSLNPELIIVDTYFSKENQQEAIFDCFKSLEGQFLEKLVFHFSPHFSENETIKLSFRGVFQTVLSKSSLNFINQVLHPSYVNSLIA